jgi:hypothetical protein
MTARSRHTQLRSQIAQVAARLMLESGIRDHDFAKRKAARQLGLANPHGLPSNDEIDQALRAHRALFEPEAQVSELMALRRQALGVLHQFERFNPFLTGALVNGAVTRFQDIEIELYLDASKGFEQFLLNAGFTFKPEEGAGYVGYRLSAEPADVYVRIRPEQDLRALAPAREDAPRRLSVTQLAQLLEQDTDTRKQADAEG